MNINVPAQAATAIPTSRENKLFYFGTILRKPREDALTPSLGARNSSFASAAEDDVKPPIAGVRLGPLLGKGSFGSVHYGTWNGAQIAVKVHPLFCKAINLKQTNKGVDARFFCHKKGTPSSS